jgi:hypothetical protein
MDLRSVSLCEKFSLFIRILGCLVKGRGLFKDNLQGKHEVKKPGNQKLPGIV